MLNLCIYKSLMCIYIEEHPRTPEPLTNKPTTTTGRDPPPGGAEARLGLPQRLDGAQAPRHRGGGAGQGPRRHTD